MVTRLQPINLEDFSGGLNLRSDAFQLQENESPEMLNVDIDPRGGVAARKGWVEWNGTAVGAATWAPTRLHVFEQPNGDKDVMLVNDGDIYVAAAGVFSQLSDASAVIPADAAVHGCDFADWAETVYMAPGKTQACRSWTGSGNAVALTASAPTFQDDYTAPTGGYMPSCEFLTTYQGYMVAAYTKEDGTEYPNRVRISHPGAPTDWKSTDYVDIEAGGPRITGIASFSDHIIVFKTNSVWAIYGYDADSFTPVNITMSVGAPHRNAIALGQNAAYFYAHPAGVHLYKPSEGVFEISPQLRPIMDGGDLNENYVDGVTVGYTNRKVWFSAPYEQNAVPTTNRACFVFDPGMDAWTLYTDANGDGLGVFATGGNQGDGALLLAAHPISQRVLELDKVDTAKDTIDGATAGFSTLYATKWQHAGWPALRKSWRRPDYIVTEKDVEYDLTVEVMRDYEEANPRSSHTVTVQTGQDDAQWGTFTWGTDTWGTSPRGAHIERGGSVGLARSVQLRFIGEVGYPWGLNAIVMKYRSRRFR